MTDWAGIRYLSSASIAASATSPGRSGNSSRATFLANAGVLVGEARGLLERGHEGLDHAGISPAMVEGRTMMPVLQNGPM